MRRIDLNLDLVTLVISVKNGEERVEYEINKLESIIPFDLHVRYIRFLLCRRPVSSSSNLSPFHPFL